MTDDMGYADLGSYGSVTQVEISSENGGEIVLDNPFKGVDFSCNKSYTTDGQTLIFKLDIGESVLLK